MDFEAEKGVETGGVAPMPLVAAGCLDAGVGVVIVCWCSCEDARRQRSRSQA